MSEDSPLPAPRYERYFTPEERRGLQYETLGELADEAILIRARLARLIAYSRRGLPLARLTSTVRLFSRFAVRLGRILLQRQALAALRRESEPPQDAPPLFDHRSPDEKELQGIRSSKKFRRDFFINTPLYLTPLQWEAIGGLLPPQPRPSSSLDAVFHRAVSYRAVFEAILWKLLTYNAWDDLPKGYPAHATCYRYYRHWRRDGTLDRLLAALADYQHERAEQEEKSARQASRKTG